MPFGSSVAGAKGGIPSWAIALIATVIIVPLIVVGIFASVPDGAPGPRGSDATVQEARSAEARATLGALGDRARVVYQRSPHTGLDIKSLGATREELTGRFFDASAYTCGGTPDNWRARCRNVFETGDPDLEITVNLITGKSSFNR